MVKLQIGDAHNSRRIFEGEKWVDDDACASCLLCKRLRLNAENPDQHWVDPGFGVVAGLLGVERATARMGRFWVYRCLIYP